MSPIRNDFIPSRMPLIVWSVATAILLGELSGASWVGWRSWREINRLRAEKGQLESELIRARLAAKTPEDPRREAMAKVASALSFDLNRVMSPAESAIDGVYVTELSWELSGRTARLQFALDSSARIPEVSEALNSTEAAWTLESLQTESENSGKQRVAPISANQSLPGQIRATWVGHFVDK